MELEEEAAGEEEEAEEAEEDGEGEEVEVVVVIERQSERGMDWEDRKKKGWGRREGGGEGRQL